MSEWHKSSYSGARGDCVEAAESPTAVHVRDTSHRELGHLTFSPREWSALIPNLKKDARD